MGPKAKQPTPEELAAQAEAEEQARLEAEAAEAAEQERLKEEAKLQAEREAHDNNIGRVAFQRTDPKQIVSPHSGSILASEGPVVPLDKDLANTAMDVFQEFLAEAGAEASQGGASQGEEGKTVEAVHKALLPEIVKKCGFEMLPDIVDATVEQMYRGPEMIDMEIFLQFLSKFQAPDYYYGQRLRKNAGRNQIPEMLELLARNCDVNTADGEGLTSLHYCCQFNRPDAMRALIDAAGKKLVVNAQCKYGWTPLHTAVHHGYQQCVSIMLELQPNLEVVDRHGKTALHFATAQGRETIAQLLINAGASVSSTDALGMTVAHDAAYRGHFEMYHSLQKMPDLKKTLDSAQDVLGYNAEEYNQEFKTPASEAR